MMYVWSLVKYLPGVTKFGQLKMIQNVWSPFIKYNIFQGVHYPSCWKKTPPWTFCVLSLCSCSLGHVGPSCHPHMFPMFHLIETSPARPINKTVKCRWRLETRVQLSSPWEETNQPMQVVYGQIILIHPVDQHLVKTNRNFQNMVF